MKLQQIFLHHIFLNITHWPDIKGIETIQHLVMLLTCHYTLTRYKGDWNTVSAWYLLSRYITHWPDIKGIETYPFCSIIFLILLITHWPDIKGIETPVKVVIFIDDYYTLTRYKGDWNTSSCSYVSKINHYTLTRYKGDWNSVPEKGIVDFLLLHIDPI